MPDQEAKPLPDAEEARTLVSNALRILAQDNSTAADVAATLRKKEVKGHTGSGCMCPVAQFIVRLVPGVVVTVHPITVGVHSSHGNPNRWGPLFVDTPLAVGEFIEQFDNNKFPELQLSLD